MAPFTLIRQPAMAVSAAASHSLQELRKTGQRLLNVCLHPHGRNRFTAAGSKIDDGHRLRLLMSLYDKPVP